MKTVKYMIMILAATFIGIFSNPENLAASNTVAVNGLNNAGIVETVVPEPEPEPEPVKTVTVTAPKAGVAATAKTTTVATTTAAPAPVNNGFKIASAVYNDTIVVKPDGAPIYKTGKLYYGHSYGVMGGIKKLTIGDTVTTEDGVAHKVTDIQIYDLVDGTLNGNKYLMGKVKNGMGHAVSMMTCHGNNDSQRYVVYAD